MQVASQLHELRNLNLVTTEFLSKFLRNKRVFGGKTWNGFVIVKSLGKYEQRYKVVSAIIVAKLLTRLPMKRGERPTVSAYIGVIILFLTNGIITPNATLLSPSGFFLVGAKVNTKKHNCFLVVSKKSIFLLTFIKIATSKFLWKNLKMQLSNFRFWGVWL